ncbi:MAG: DUF6432 family protein [Halobacteriales archaeon]
MPVKREYRDRDEVEVAVLDALVDRGEEGMTVLELRTSVDASIDRIEVALGDLKDDSLITVEQTNDQTLIKPADRVVPEPGETEPDPSIGDWLRDRLPFFSR